ncbi:hypothetical protein NPIL_22851, partial [Nephila pilipes]
MHFNAVPIKVQIPSLCPVIEPVTDDILMKRHARARIPLKMHLVQGLTLVKPSEEQCLLMDDKSEVPA